MFSALPVVMKRLHDFLYKEDTPKYEFTIININAEFKGFYKETIIEAK